MIFHCLVLGLFRKKTKHDMLTKFYKMKPFTFLGSKMEDVVEFIFDCYKMQHQMRIMEKHGVMFVTF